MGLFDREGMEATEARKIAAYNRAKKSEDYQATLMALEDAIVRGDSYAIVARHVDIIVLFYLSCLGYTWEYIDNDTATKISF